MFITYIVVAIISLCFFTYKLNKRRDKSPPGPLCLPFIGSAWSLGTRSYRTHIALTNLAKKWGPIYEIYFGNQPVVVITSPKLIHEAFTGLHSPALLRFMSKTLFQMTTGRSFFNSTREGWGMIHKLASPIIKNTPGGIPINQIITNEIAKLVAHMEKHTAQGVRIYPWLMFFTRNVFLQIAIRKSWEFDTTDPEEQQFNTAMEEAIDNMNSIADFFPALDFLAWRSRRITLKHSEHIRQYILKIIEERKAENEKRTDETARDFLDMVLLGGSSNTEISSEVISITIRDLQTAATLTTSDALDWLIMYMCDHPDIQEKCYQEIYGKLQGRIPTLDDKNDLQYLDGVLKEVLRLRPPAPASLPHLVDQDFELGGYHIKKGSIVVQNLYGIGNWDKYYDEAENFDPDRWLKNPELSENLLHFGVGPTMCLGMPIAKQEMFLAAASILQKFRFHFAPETPIDFTGEFKTTFNAKPWQAVFYPRLTSPQTESGSGTA